MATTEPNQVDVDIQLQQNQFILNELERINDLFKMLVARGVLTARDEAIVQLAVDIKHMERLVRVLEANGQDVTDQKTKLQALQNELLVLERLDQ